MGSVVKYCDYNNLAPPYIKSYLNMTQIVAIAILAMVGLESVSPLRLHVSINEIPYSNSRSWKCIEENSICVWYPNSCCEGLKCQTCHPDLIVVKFWDPKYWEQYIYRCRKKTC